MSSINSKILELCKCTVECNGKYDWRSLAMDVLRKRRPRRSLANEEVKTTFMVNYELT